MQTINYKGTDYPVRTLTAIISGRTQTITIADTTLLSALEANNLHGDPDEETENTDNEIYYYVGEGQLELSGEEICAEHLDEPITFVEDEEA